MRAVPKSLPGAAKVSFVFMSILLACGLGLLALGGSMFFSNWRTRQAVNREQGVVLPLSAGHWVRTEFIASGKFPYSIDLSLSPLRTNSNIRIPPTDLEQLTKLDVEWSVRDGTSVIASGNATNAPHYNPHAAFHRGTQLGFVRLGHSGNYEFAVKLNSDLPGGASPAVAIKPFAGRAMVNAAMKNFVGGILCLIGIFLLGIALLSVSRRKS